MKNFHVRLPDDIYTQLLAEAARTQVPATTLACGAIGFWLRHQLKMARHDAIAAYAAEMAGTSFDLDPDLESAGMDHLVRTGKRPKLSGFNQTPSWRSTSKRG